MTDQPSLLDLAEELYGLPPPDFTGRRDALVAAHRGTELAADLKRLRKPTTAAWAVNLLVRHETEQIAGIIEVGAALREAQQDMEAAQLRELTGQRRRLTAAATTRARVLAREHGGSVSAAVADQVEATLTAAMVDAEAARAVRSGLLIGAMRSTGMDPVDVGAAVASAEALGFEATPAPPPEPHLHAVPDPEPDEGEIAAAREALESAEDEVAAAGREAEVAAAEHDRHRARTLQLHAEVDELRRGLAEAEERAASAEDAQAEAASASEDAAAVLAEARRTRERAAAELDRLT